MPTSPSPTDGIRGAGICDAEHAGLVGLGEIADAPPTAIAKMAFEQPTSSIASEARAHELFTDAGFRVVAPFYRGFWYAGWWLEAV